MWQFLPAALSAGANLLGGLFGQKQQQQQQQQQLAWQREQFAQQQANWQQQFGFSKEQWEEQKRQYGEQFGFSKEQLARSEALQREFAQSGIQWRVEDARKAGLHPLAALGAGGAAFGTPSVSVGTSGGVAPGGGSVGGFAGPSAGASPIQAALSGMGQDLSRAIMATNTQAGRDLQFQNTLQAMQLENMALRNEYIGAQLGKLRGQVGPPIPATGPLPPIGEANKQEDRPPMQVGGVRWVSDPGTTNQEEFAKRYGDEGPVSWITQALIAWQDMKANWGEPATWSSSLVDAFKRAHPLPGEAGHPLHWQSRSGGR